MKIPDTTQNPSEIGTTPIYNDVIAKLAFQNSPTLSLNFEPSSTLCASVGRSIELNVSLNSKQFLNQKR